MTTKTLFLTLVLILLFAATAESQTSRISGAFGGSAYQTKPAVEYPWGSTASLPGNYALSLNAQSEFLPFDCFAFISWDRLWSGGDVGFSNSSNVFAVGVGKSLSLGYSKFEVLAGVCNYDENFDVNSSLGGTGNLNHSVTGGVLGTQLVFRFFENVNAIVSYRLIFRDDKSYDVKLDFGFGTVITTNPLDHVITFGFGYEFGK